MSVVYAVKTWYSAYSETPTKSPTGFPLYIWYEPVSCSTPAFFNVFHWASLQIRQDASKIKHEKKKKKSRLT